MHGANNPIPIVIRAPKIKLPTIPIKSLIPVSPISLPPIGVILNKSRKIKNETINIAMPIANWILFSDNLETIFVPTIEPDVAAIIIEIRVKGSTLITVINI